MPLFYSGWKSRKPNSVLSILLAPDFNWQYSNPRVLINVLIICPRTDPAPQAEFDKFGAVTDVYNTGKG